MSQATITQLLEATLNGMSPAIATAWPNVAFTPPASGTPYQKVATLFAEPENVNINGSARFERGIFQVSLFYPLQTGAAAALARAEAVRAVFYRGATFSKSGVTVRIQRTPEILPGSVDGDRWAVPIRVRFYSVLGA